jgi:hypothetical protein
MEITKDILLERRHSLEADVIAINGAIQQVDWSLNKLEEEITEEAGSEMDPAS